MDDLLLRIILMAVVVVAVYATAKYVRSARRPVPPSPVCADARAHWRFYNFTSVALVRIGPGLARIVDVTHSQLRYVDENGVEVTIDLEDCARICQALRDAGMFPPADDTDWVKVAAARADFAALDAAHGCVGLRAAVDDPPWFQFLDRRRTQFEFTDYDAIQNDLIRPLAAAGWQTWDAS